MQSLTRSAVLPDSRTLTRALVALTFAVGTAVCAQISFRVWFSPVPVTLQVFAVILSGLALGSRWGAISMLQYLALGAMGLPVFAEMKAGPEAFVGPTGGYLIGFVAGAYLTGFIFERLGTRRGLAAWAGAICGIAAIHLCGVMWLSVWLGLVGNHSAGASLLSAFQLGCAPFIGVDLLKAALASSIVLGGSLGRGFLKKR